MLEALLCQGRSSLGLHCRAFTPTCGVSSGEVGGISELRQTRRPPPKSEIAKIKIGERAGYPRRRVSPEPAARPRFCAVYRLWLRMSSESSPNASKGVESRSALPRAPTDSQAAHDLEETRVQVFVSAWRQARRERLLAWRKVRRHAAGGGDRSSGSLSSRVLGFVGIIDQTIVRAEGTNVARMVKQAMNTAQKQIDELFSASKAA
jgi:hypothetical protein